METHKTEKYFLFGLLIVTFILTLTTLYHFLSIFILAAAFSVVIHPVFLWIKKHITMNNDSFASLITIILFLLLLCVPLFFIGNVIFNQAQNMYHFIVQNDSTNLFIQKIDSTVNNLMPVGFTFDTHGKIVSLISFITNNIGSFFAYTFSTLLMTILIIFTMFYILKDGQKWREGLFKLLPLSEKNINEILLSLKNSINRIVKGSFIIAMAQGFLFWLGLLIFGVPNPALWGVVAGLASFIPNLGTSVVSIPAILFLFFTGTHTQALGLLLWSLLLVGTIDNMLSPYVISRNTEIPAIFILFVILGGISIMGPIGIIMGPLLLSLLYSLVGIYKKETN